LSISKRWTSNTTNVERVLKAYRGRGILTIAQIAENYSTTHHNVAHILKEHMPHAERKALAKIRYSASKAGSKNPMKGKTGKKHHNWIGECEDGRGYLTCLHNGKRRFVHRVVMAKALGLKELPATLAVHHIDNDPKNNELDNLALVTRAGHTAIHYLQAEDSLLLRLKKSTIADALKYMT
jgi:hypothetical protein